MNVAECDVVVGPTVLSRLACRVRGLRHLVPGALALVALLATGVASAQTLVNGGVVSGSISFEGDVDSYSFTATAGENVLIQMADTSQTFSPGLWLYDPSGVQVKSDHDLRVAFVNWTAQTTGTYTLTAADWYASGTGDYDIHFVRVPGANEGGLLPNGGSVSGSIDLGDLDSFTFTVNAGENVLIQMADISETFTPALRLYGPTGVYLKSDNDLRVAFINHTAATAGTYTLVASDWYADGTGDYDLYFARMPGANEGGLLPNGGSVSDSIDLGDLDSYTFTATAGENVLIQLADMNQAFTPALRLYGPTGVYLKSDNDLRVAFINHVVEATGTYTVVASDWYADGSGDYDLYFARMPGANEGGLLPSGGSVSDSIGLGDLDSYTFTASAGENVQIQMSDISQTFTPALRLYGPSGAYLKSDNDLRVAILNWTVVTTGTYTVVASDWYADGTGDYDLHFVQVPGANEGGLLPNGGTIAGELSLGDLDSFTIAATAGDEINLAMVEVSGTSLSPALNLYGPTGVYLKGDHGSSDAAVSWTAASTGTYTVVASDWYGTGTGHYEIVLSIPGPWSNLGAATPGLWGDPSLTGTGTLVGLDPFTVSLTNARENTTAYLVLGLTQINAPFKGGTLVPAVDVAGFPLAVPTGPAGEVPLGGTWPAGIPSGFTMYMQYWIVDPAGPVGFSASNAISGTTP